MRLKLLLLLSVLLTTTCFSQQNNWIKWSWLIGEWKGEGGGQPGVGSGTFSFNPDLDNKILVRKAHSEYPQPGNKPSLLHDDLMIVYLDASLSPSRAIYFDNEGHTINYTISYSDKSIIFLSDKTSNTPIFRLTYTLLDRQTVNTRFEMSRDGVQFITYIEGKSKKLTQ